MQLVRATRVAMLIATHNMRWRAAWTGRVSLVDGQSRWRGVALRAAGLQPARGAPVSAQACTICCRPDGMQRLHKRVHASFAHARIARSRRVFDTARKRVHAAISTTRYGAEATAGPGTTKSRQI